MVDESAVDTLNQLIETCRNGEMGFWAASEHLEDAGLKSMFHGIARTRGHFAEELKDEVQRLGGTPSEGGSMAGAVHRGWMEMRGAVTRRGDGSIIQEAARGDEAAVTAYEAALRSTLPAPTRSMIVRQHKAVKDVHDRLQGLEHEWRRRE